MSRRETVSVRKAIERPRADRPSEQPISPERCVGEEAAESPWTAWALYTFKPWSSNPLIQTENNLLGLDAIGSGSGAQGGLGDVLPEMRRT